MLPSRVFLLSCLAIAPASAAPATQGLDPARLDRLPALVADRMHDDKVAGAVIIVARNGHIAYQKTIGFADRASKAPMRPDSIFRIYSMTKPIVAVAALTLYEQGKFDLRDPVSDYLPEFANMQVAETTIDAAGRRTTRLVPAAHPITVLDLFRHTAGLGYFFTKDATGALYDQKYGLGDTTLSLADWTRRLAKAPLISQPGTIFSYSYGLDVVGRLIEVWSGQKLDAYLDAAIFKKLAMKDTAFYVPPEKLARLVTLYTPSTPGIIDADGINGLGGPIIPYPSGPGPQDSFKHPVKRLSGGGGLVSTASDYANFAMMLANGGTLNGIRIVSPHAIDLMHADLLGDIPRGVGGPWPGYGFGLAVEVSKGPAATATLSTAGEFDWGGIASTNFFVDPQEHVAAIMMMQVLPSAPYWGRMLRQLVTQAIIAP